VGRIAGLPGAVIARARTLLKLLEGGDLAHALAAGSASGGPASEQLPLFAAPAHPVVDRLRAIDPNALTPIGALQVLAELALLVRDPPGTGGNA
jgi:DNA mismatch repair protein MutS